MAAVGIALNGWSQVEVAMSSLFYVVSGIDNEGKAGAIFDAVISLETRLAILDAAIENEPSVADDCELWAALSARIRKLYKKRHEVAHFLTPSSPQTATSISPFFSLEKHYRGTNKTLTDMEILQRAEKFGDVADAVTWFRDVWLPKVRLERPPSEPPEEPPLISHILESLSQKKVVPLRPPRS